MLKKLFIVAIAAVSLSASALVNNPAPGTTDNTPDPLALGGTQLANQILPFTGVDAFNNVHFTGFLASYVYSDTVNNPAGLTFVWQFINSANSIDPINRLAINGWGTTVAAAGFNNTTVAIGGLAPTAITREADGSTLGFSFVNNSVVPGANTAFLIAYSDANNWTQTSASLIDGGTANVPTFGPLLVNRTPDGGMMMALLGLGLVAVEGLRRKLS